MQGKLWVENPYMSKYPGIGYREEGGSIFEHLLNLVAYGKKIDMRPIYLEGLDVPMYAIADKKVNALYTKVPLAHYYMMGDNRENSNDSRFWGAVPYRNIIAKPWFVLFSMEHRSYENVFNGDESGSGRDHDGLDIICKDVALDSKECEEKWSDQRFHIRWERLGRSFDWLQKQDFVRKETI